MYATLYSQFVSGKTCPKGMSLVYGKCIGVVANTESDSRENSNCRWKSDSLSYRLAIFDNIKVHTTVPTFVIQPLYKLGMGNFFINSINQNSLLFNQAEIDMIFEYLTQNGMNNRFVMTGTPKTTTIGKYILLSIKYFSGCCIY